MPTTWDPDTGLPVEGTVIVRDKILRIADSLPDGGTVNGKLAVDNTTEQSLVVNGKIIYLQNVGDNKVYMHNKTGVSEDHWEIPVRGKAGPITATGKLFFKGAGATTLKYIFVG
ncbi:hypothetical protein [Paenibacillus kandeliae]|uniref:hypothetical protein n=1 Tax=Paenibacillus kandeliae TaxID=3231269 RepID=UPI00345AC30D